METELWYWSATDLAKAIREKKVSSREVVQAHLDRIEAVNGQVNAVTVVLRTEALGAADEADEAVAGGADLGPLHGVPMTVKENVDLAGSPSTCGVVAYKDAVPAVDAPHIAQLKQAGAIPIGRTNMPDYGLRLHTDSSLRGATLNPWDASRTPGGSSGGEAAALAAGMTPLGNGNDYGGSVRYPAQCCGIAGLRPTLGRIAQAYSIWNEGLSISAQLFAVQGPMARHVADLRIALEAMSGPDPRDSWWTPAPLRGPALAEPIKVAVTVDPGGSGVDPDVAEGVRKAARILTGAGYEVEQVEPPSVEEAADLRGWLSRVDIHTTLLAEIEREASEEAIKSLLLRYPRQEDTLLDYVQALVSRHRVTMEWSQFQERYPLILGPVSTLQPFEVGYDVSGVENVANITRSLRLTQAVNLLGLPSVALPVAVSGGLPQAVQIIGPRYREDLCLDAAEAIERDVGTFTPIDPRH